MNGYMKRLARAGALVSLLLAAGSAGVHAQFAEGPLPGSDWVSLSLDFGLLAPTSTFEDATFGQSSFKSGAALGASVMAWPFQGRLGVGARVVRSQTDGENSQFDLAPLVVNSPVQWLFTSEVSFRHPMVREGFSGFPYLSAGAGLKQYNWAKSVHKEDRFFLWSVGGGFELRPRALGPLGLTLDVRSYHSELIAFGIDDGTWKPGTEALPGIGFYGGVVGGQSNHDLLLTTGISVAF